MKSGIHPKILKLSKITHGKITLGKITLVFEKVYSQITDNFRPVSITFKYLVKFQRKLYTGKG